MDFESSLLTALSTGNIDELKKLGIDKTIANEIIARVTQIPERRGEQQVSCVSYPTPLVYAICCKQPKSVQYLLDIGADINIKVQNWLPIHYAAISHSIPVMKVLLRMFPDSVNSLSNNKSTPLHFAVSANDYQMVLCLLMNKANPNLLNNLGQSPLHLSIVSTEQKIFKALVAFHADLHIKDVNGRTPLDIATHRELIHVSRVLQSYSEGTNIPSEEEVINDFIEEDQYSDVEEDEEITRNPAEELDVIEEKVKNLENSLKQNK